MKIIVWKKDRCKTLTNYTLKLTNRKMLICTIYFINDKSFEEKEKKTQN